MASSSTRCIAKLRIAALAALVLAPPIHQAGASECDTHRIEVRPASAADIPNFESFLLRVERQGVPDSYLFGTFHSADPRVTGNWAWLRVLLSTWKPRLVVVERDLLKEGRTGSTGSKQAAGTAIEGIAAADPELYRLAVQTLTELGLSKSKVDGLSVLQAVALLEQTPRHTRPKQRQPILDVFLQSAARELRIPVLAIETREALTKRIATDMTAARQRELLWVAICNGDFNARSLVRQSAAFAANDVAALYRAMGSLSTGQDSAQAEFVESLLKRRNQSFWGRLEPEFEKGDLLVAVGNLHLFSPGGLLDRLSDSGRDGKPYRVYPVSAQTLRFGLKTEYLLDLINWVQAWIREQEGIEIEYSDFDALNVQFRAETALQAAFCPGRRCRIEASYEPGQRRILLTETVFSRLTAAGYPVTWRLDESHGRAEDGAAWPNSESAVYPESILVRELVRHGFAVYDTRSESEQGHAGTGSERASECRRSYQLHRASIAQAQFLREKLSRTRPYVFPLDPECSAKNMH